MQTKEISFSFEIDRKTIKNQEATTSCIVRVSHSKPLKIILVRMSLILFKLFSQCSSSSSHIWWCAVSQKMWRVYNALRMRCPINQINTPKNWEKLKKYFDIKNLQVLSILKEVLISSSCLVSSHNVSHII